MTIMVAPDVSWHGFCAMLMTFVYVYTWSLKRVCFTSINNTLNVHVFLMAHFCLL